jgi:multiple sugar transport system ATP-binding protein
VEVVEPLGAEIHLWIKTETQSLVARTEPHHAFNIGQSINLVPRLDKARYFDKETELSILREPDAMAQ